MEVGFIHCEVREGEEGDGELQGAQPLVLDAELDGGAVGAAAGEGVEPGARGLVRLRSAAACEGQGPLIRTPPGSPWASSSCAVEARLRCGRGAWCEAPARREVPAWNG